jgi:FAD/FMN-containing dehydrogenase
MSFQTAYSHRPSVVVAATSVDDVRAALRRAVDEGVPFDVQTTGHGLTEPLDGGVLVTTAGMAGVDIDPVARTARVQAGTTWDTVVTAAGAHGLAALSGSSPGVGVVGYTLGGGLGLLSRRYGWATDHVRSIDVVTPDGELRHVTAGDELFRRLRGAGRGLGVVTGLEIGLFPVSRIFGGGLYFAAEHVPDVLRAYVDWTADLPDAMTSSVGLIPFPDAAPPPLGGRYVAHVRIVFTGDAEEGERLVAPLRAVAPRVLDTLGDMPFTDSASIYNDPPWPHAYSGTNALLAELDDPAPLVDVAGPGAPMMCVVQLNHLGGALARPPAVPDAVEHRDARFLLRVISPLDGTDEPAVAAVHAELMAAVAGPAATA